MQQLRLFDLAHIERRAVYFGQRLEEFPIVPFSVPQGSLGGHVDGLKLGLTLVFNRTHLDAQRTTCAILGRDLQDEFLLFVPLVAGFGILEGLRRVGQ